MRVDTRRSQTGTALMLVPAMLMVVMVLGGIAVDLSLAYSAQRSLYRTLSAAADDAASMVDTRAHQINGSVRLDTDAATRVARTHLGVVESNLGADTARAHPTNELLDSSVLVTADSVTVTATVSVEHIFMKAVPGSPDSSEVTVVAVGKFAQ